MNRMKGGIENVVL